MKLRTAKERVFDKCNLIGIDCDVISVMMQYKSIRELSESEFDKVYWELVERLGFTW